MEVEGAVQGEQLSVTPRSVGYELTNHGSAALRSTDSHPFCALMPETLSLFPCELNVV